MKKTNVKQTGKHKGKILHYYAFTNPRRKIRHILKSAGLDAAKKWAEEHGALVALAFIRKEKGI